ncbi:MAG: cytidine deaminase [Cryomorphaceae bacterium]|nr:cytidine deaminase [Flavobacteriales bacterium]
MEQKEIHLKYRVASDISGLEPDDAALFKEALKAMESAYAPYSHFSVGAAVELENGVTVRGSNQENIAYPSGLCAERVAVFAAASAYPGVKMRAIAVVASFKGPDNAAADVKNDSSDSVTPCGACRQVMMEYERLLGQPIRIITGGADGSIIVLDSAEALLPLVFFSEALTKQVKE